MVAQGKTLGYWIATPSGFFSENHFLNVYTTCLSLAARLSQLLSFFCA